MVCEKELVFDGETYCENGQKFICAAAVQTSLPDIRLTLSDTVILDLNTIEVFLTKTEQGWNWYNHEISKVVGVFDYTNAFLDSVFPTAQTNDTFRLWLKVVI